MPVSPYQKVSTVAPFLLDCSSLLPISGHVIGVRQRRGSGVRGFGAKETQPMSSDLKTYLKMRELGPNAESVIWISFALVFSCMYC